MKKLCYLAGPISGASDFEQRFATAAKEVIKLGMVPVNPVTLLHDHEQTWEAYMKESLKAMMDCEAIYMIDGWKYSKGARIEHSIASAFKYEIIYQ